IFHRPDVPASVGIRHTEGQRHPIDMVLDRRLIAEAAPALDYGRPVEIAAPISNVDRTAGAMLSGEVAARYGHEGLPESSIKVTLTGTAGQSFGAFLAAGVEMTLIGQANDYVGKGLSGGRLIIRPSPDTPAVPERSIIVGNTVLYGAI